MSKYGIIHGGFFLIKGDLNPPYWTPCYLGKHPLYITESKVEVINHIQKVRDYFNYKDIEAEGMKIYTFTEEDTFKILAGTY